MLGELLLENLQAVVSAAIVGDNDVGDSDISALDNGRQIMAQQFGTIPIQYDDSNLFHVLFGHDLGINAQVIVKGQ